MRFYPQSRITRLLVSALWLLLAIACLFAPRIQFHSWGTPQKVIWITLSIMQMISMWSYWEITPTDLRHQSPVGRGRSFPLRDLQYVGPMRTSRWSLWWAKNITEVQFAGKPPVYVGVSDRDSLRAELNRVRSTEA